MKILIAGQLKKSLIEMATIIGINTSTIMVSLIDPSTTSSVMGILELAKGFMQVLLIAASLIYTVFKIHKDFLKK